jgi:glycosyltransferase involved in cell wall biosynthesis
MSKSFLLLFFKKEVLPFLRLKAFLFDRSLPLTGGVAQSFLHLGRHSDPTRISWHAVACQRTIADGDAEFAAAGIMPHSIGDRGYARPAWALRQLLRRHRPDVILCCSLKPYLLARIAACGLHTRVVFWHVAITDILDGALRSSLYRILARNADVLANSHATAEAVGFAGHRGRTRVVHLGVPDATAAPLAARPAPPGMAGDARIIAYTANFVAYKKHDILLDAFAILAPEYADLHLLLIGAGPAGVALKARAGALPSGRVHFAGARSDVRELLATIEIYAHPAVGEGFGIAVVEAMLAGLPVVAANAGALPELIDDMRTGLLCAPDDAADLAACLRRLLDDPDLRSALGRAARETARSRFTPEAYAACLTGVVAEFAAPP